MATNVLTRAQAVCSDRSSLSKKRLSAKRRAEEDRAAWASLNALSPEGLQPVVVRRHGGDFLVGWIFDRLPGSVRILVRRGDWGLVRVRKSALVRSVPKSKIELHEEASRRQDSLGEALRELWGASK